MTVYDPFRGSKTLTGSSPKTKPVEVVPTGTVSELLDWVGSDKDKARKVLELEESSDKPRKSLVKDLKEILSD